mgnify:FL=1
MDTLNDLNERVDAFVGTSSFDTPAAANGQAPIDVPAEVHEDIVASVDFSEVKLADEFTEPQVAVTPNGLLPMEPLPIDGRLRKAALRMPDEIEEASGFTLFDASIKEEYGYGIYDNVFTTADIERMLNEGRVAKADGSRPRRIAFLHCVGSRDEKVCQQHCSKVCCITGVKQAMEMKQLFPEADVFNFYMDIRMFGPGYEEMYREAQQRYNIHFLRGRISEASPTIDGRVQIKAEDTLTGRPLRMSVDMLVLIVGMRANDDNEAFAAGAGLNRAPSGFLAPRDMFLGNVKSNVDGIFYAGTITAPKNIGESLNEGIAAADAAAKYVEA